MILKENILSKITKLPQDPNKTSHSHTIQHSFRFLSVGLSVQLRLPQTELIPHLQPHQRHLPHWNSENPKQVTFCPLLFTPFCLITLPLKPMNVRVGRKALNERIMREASNQKIIEIVEVVFV